MKNTITKEYMMSVEELRYNFPLGSIHEIDGIHYKVEKINDAMPAQGFATFPSITFHEIKPNKDFIENEGEYDDR